LLILSVFETLKGAGFFTVFAPSDGAKGVIQAIDRAMTPKES